MLIITGTFENERFIPDEPILIPQKKKVTVTVDDDLPVSAQRQVIRQAAFDKCRLDMSDFKFNRDEANDYE